MSCTAGAHIIKQQTLTGNTQRPSNGAFLSTAHNQACEHPGEDDAKEQTNAHYDRTYSSNETKWQGINIEEAYS